MKIILTILLTSFLLSGCSSDAYYSGRFDEYEVEEREPLVTSENWECTSDCSGHEAGYEWAADKGITDPDDCGGNSNSFIEGCEAWANEQMLDEEYDDETYTEYR